MGEQSFVSSGFFLHSLTLTNNVIHRWLTECGHYMCKVLPPHFQALLRFEWSTTNGIGVLVFIFPATWKLLFLQQLHALIPHHAAPARLKKLCEAVQWCARMVAEDTKQKDSTANSVIQHSTFAEIVNRVIFSLAIQVRTSPSSDCDVVDYESFPSCFLLSSSLENPPKTPVLKGPPNSAIRDQRDQGEGHPRARSTLRLN